MWPPISWCINSMPPANQCRSNVHSVGPVSKMRQTELVYSNLPGLWFGSLWEEIEIIISTVGCMLHPLKSLAFLNYSFKPDMFQSDMFWMYIYMYMYMCMYVYVCMCMCMCMSMCILCMCMCMFLLLTLMLWHRQTIFLSKGDKLSSAECRIRTQGLRHQIASRQTDWAIED